MKTQIGEHLWLWSHGVPGKASALIISAHGAVLADSFTPPAGSRLVFYAPPEHALIDPNLIQVAEGNVIAKEVVEAGTSRNYALTKFQGKKHGSEDETYDRIEKILKGFFFEGGKPPDVEILTVRNRMDPRLLSRRRADHGSQGVTLATSLTQLQTKGFTYPEIRCSFCRGTTNPFDKRSFSPYNPSIGSKPRYDS
jgi:hypothetical protein